MFDVPSYDELLSGFGYEIALRVDDDAYQGDTRVLFRRDESYGWLQFGWGSCSGCDALQACDSQDDVARLAAQLKAEIRWFDSASAALTFFQAHDWEGDYSWGAEEQKRFVSEAAALLEEALRAQR